jgi:hypothetical protein
MTAYRSAQAKNCLNQRQTNPLQKQSKRRMVIQKAKYDNAEVVD